MNNNEQENQEVKFVRTDKVKSSLKAKDSARLKNEINVRWDQKKLDELEKYKIEHHVTKKITEPKTPYQIYEVKILI